jgi:ribosome-associated protein
MALERTIESIETTLADHKAADVVRIDLAGKTDYADAMIIASGQSARHVGALADYLAEALKALGPPGQPAPAIEGTPQCDWVLLDAGDVVVHLFRPEVRAFYNLEKMWGLPCPPLVQARTDAASGLSGGPGLPPAPLLMAAATA